jgi:diguanylate cyclase (GGDEF)-like protein
MLSKTKSIWFGCLFLIFSTSAIASFTFGEVEELPPLPKLMDELGYAERVLWLVNKIEVTEKPVEIYRLNRNLFFNHYYERKDKLAGEVCNSNVPLRDDYYYREICIVTVYPKFQEFISRALELVHDAKQANDFASAAEILNNIAWRQSQFGDISGAYASYESALSLAPSDNKLLISTIMMDTATNYIVHGNDDYVEKGIKLLERIRFDSIKALESETDPNKIAGFKENVYLTNFNTGIAYLLHLYHYEKSLVFFDKVNESENNFLVSSLSFSAFAAAKSNQFERAKKYIEKLADRKEGLLVIDTYLACYRELAERHWNKKQPLNSCLNLEPETTVEVEFDVYKILAEFDDPKIQLAGLKKLKDLFLNKLEPQLKNRGSSAASNTELKRLQRESELKSVVLEQQEELQKERDNTHANRQRLFIASFLILVFFILLVISQWRQKKKLAEQYQRMSIRDPLTKLGNRRFLEQQIQRELAYVERARRTDETAALGIYIFDIDHFKKVNDTYGHQAGDEVLVEISKRINQSIRDTDLFIRWGGEEFVYVARLDNNNRTHLLADRILNAINQTPFIISNYDPIKVTCTIGVVKYPFIDSGHHSLWTKLISLADAALYYGKMKSRNCWVIINNESVVDKPLLDELLTLPLEQAIKKEVVTVTTSFD